MTLKEKRDYINVMTKKYKITLEEILDTFDKCEICDMYDAVEFIVYQHENSLEQVGKEIQSKFRSYASTDQ